MIEHAVQRDPVEEVAAEFIDRCRDGEPPSIEAYAAQHPELAESIHELFPTIAALECVKRDDRQAAARSATLQPLKLTELGEFEILREIGRGGMGIVYEAQQKSLGRRVALKVLPKQALLDPIQLRRFQREARIAARLHHTNIVSLYGVGEHDGFHFLVMELIDGAPLNEVISRLQVLAGSTSFDAAREVKSDQALKQKIDQLAIRLFTSDDVGNKSARKIASSPTSDVFASNGHAIHRLPEIAPAVPLRSIARQKRDYWRNIARIGRDAARALQHAFDQGVLHRDIKPGNLLLDMNGNIWVGDFGLAQALNAHDVSTTQSIGGTLCYMPPEGFSGSFDGRSDIYGLGLTLYELLTFKPAFSDRSPAESLKRIARDSFQPLQPMEIDSDIPRDLETIVLKAIAQEPKQRYSTADDLAADLQRFLDNRPVQARRTSAWDRLWRWCARNKAIATLATIAISLLLLTTIIMALSFLHARKSNRDVKAALVRETKQRERSEATLVVAKGALDDIYEQFAPSDLHDHAKLMKVDGIKGPLPRSSVAQPVLSTETAIVLENLLTFYDRLAEETGPNLLLEEASTKALGRIGDIHRQLGQHRQALERYGKALQTIERLRNNLPGHVELVVEDARILNEIGRVHVMSGNYLSARHSHRQALETLDRIGETANTPAQLYERARSLYFLGRRRHVSASRVAIEQLAEAMQPPIERVQGPMIAVDEASYSQQTERLRSAVDILANLSPHQRSESAYQFLLACCYRELAQTGEGSSSSAVRMHGEKAVELFSDLVERFPNNQHYRFELAETLRSDIYAAPHIAEGRMATLRSLRCALVHANQLVRRHPNVPQYAMSRMHVLHKLGHVLTHMARGSTGEERATLLAEAKTALQGARDQIQLLTSRWPNVLPYQLWSIVVDGSLAQVLLDLESKPEAIEALQTAITSLDSMSEADHVNPHVKSDLPAIYRALSGLARRADADDLIKESSAGIHEPELSE